MDLDYEKNRLLEMICIDYLVFEDVDIKLENIDLNIEKSVNSSGYNLTIFSDIKMNPNDVVKYTNSSEIEVCYRINDINYDTIEEGYVYIYFDGALFDNEFKGNKTIEYKFEGLNLDEIEEIMIDVDASLYEKEDDDEDNKVEIVLTYDEEKFKDELRKILSSRDN